MRKLRNSILVVALLAAVLFFAGLLADKAHLGQDFLRLHVIGASNEAADQAVKLQVRDAVLKALEPGLAGCESVEQAKVYIAQHLGMLEEAANAALDSAGRKDRAQVLLGREAYPTRNYDTFSLPSGVYESLRVVIGSGEGKNWWCVVFPSLCVPASADGFREVSVEAGVTPTMQETLATDGRYTLRFFLLECLGRLENFFYTGSF